MLVNIYAPVEIDLEEICSKFSHDDAFKLIKLIDFMMEDWDFTKECHEYFNTEMGKFDNDTLQCDGDVSQYGE